MNYLYTALYLISISAAIYLGYFFNPHCNNVKVWYASKNESPRELRSEGKGPERPENPRELCSLDKGSVRSADTDSSAEEAIKMRRITDPWQPSEHLGNANISYLVYDCSKLNKYQCGGLSDRISGMMTVYILSILSGKKFLIHHDKPYQLSDYLSPNKYNWKFNKSLLRGKSRKFHNYFCKFPDIIKNYSKAEIQKLFSADINFVQINWDFARQFRKQKSVFEPIPWVAQLETSDMYSKFFKFLFKPKETIFNYVENIMKNRKKKLACAHIRIGGSKTLPGDDPVTNPRDLWRIWSFLLEMEQKNYDIFVATDSDDMKHRAEAMFKRNLIVTPGKVIHVGRITRSDNRSIPEGVRKSFLDFFILTKCHELILTRSGFGVTAAYLNEVYDHLYCFQTGVLVPCSRYTVGEYMKGIFYAPFE